MVDLDWKTKISNKLQISIPPPPIPVAELSAASDSSCSAYEHYLRLPELRNIWSAAEFPGWKSAPVLRPAFVGLEITFRLISTVFSDPRPYANRREWKRRLEALAVSQIEIIAALCEEDEEDPETRATIPIVDLTCDGGVLAPTNSSAEVWKLSHDTVVVSHVSEGSLLPRLADWDQYDVVARKIRYSIECWMQGCPYTLGLGEPNLSGKPSLDYDRICKPAEVHSLKKCPNDDVYSMNPENRTLYSTHQILESWIRVAAELLEIISGEIDSRRYERAANHCWTLEKVWAIASQIEDLHLLMDPDDFLRLKNELAIKASSGSDLFCFRSRGLVGITKSSKDLKHRVPAVLEVEVDPTGGPRIQDAAMELYRRKEGDFGRIHLMQAMQAVEAAVKRFYFCYKQLLAAVMGSLEANKGNGESGDLLSRIFMEPTYFPSLDAAKTFLGEWWSQESGRCSPERRRQNGNESVTGKCLVNLNEI